MDEAALIAGCRNGAADARRDLYQMYAERMYRTALRITRDEHAAADVTQEAFVRAFTRIDSFDERSRFSTWLYRIVANEALQLLRKQRTEKRHLQRIATQTTEIANERASENGPDIEAALVALSAEHRAILVLRYQEGLNYDEIAAALEIPPGTVASRLNRARSELRKRLADPGKTGEETDPLQHPTSWTKKAATGPTQGGME